MELMNLNAAQAAGLVPSGALYASKQESARSAVDPEQVKQIHETAQAFEGILLRQMLREIRNASLFSPPKTSNTAYLEMADEQLANHVSASGGFGFASKMAEQMLQQIQAKSLITTAQTAVKP
jgi:Rod binding domain-containing protein